MDLMDTPNAALQGADEDDTEMEDSSLSTTMALETFRVNMRKMRSLTVDLYRFDANTTSTQEVLSLSDPKFKLRKWNNSPSPGLVTSDPLEVHLPSNNEISNPDSVDHGSNLQFGISDSDDVDVNVDINEESTFYENNEQLEESELQNTEIFEEQEQLLEISDSDYGIPTVTDENETETVSVEATSQDSVFTPENVTESQPNDCTFDEPPFQEKLKADPNDVGRISAEEIVRKYLKDGEARTCIPCLIVFNTAEDRLSHDNEFHFCTCFNCSPNFLGQNGDSGFLEPLVDTAESGEEPAVPVSGEYDDVEDHLADNNNYDLELPLPHIQTEIAPSSNPCSVPSEFNVYTCTIEPRPDAIFEKIIFAKKNSSSNQKKMCTEKNRGCGEKDQSLNNNNQIKSPVSAKVTTVLVPAKVVYVCGFCDTICLSKTQWIRHSGLGHTFECPFCCKICCKWKRNMKNHILQAHRNTNSENEIIAACKTLKPIEVAVCPVNNNIEEIQNSTVKVVRAKHGNQKRRKVPTFTIMENKAQEATRTYSRQIPGSVPQVAEASNSESVTPYLELDTRQEYHPDPIEMTVTPTDIGEDV